MTCLASQVSPRSVAVMKRQIRRAYSQGFNEALAVPNMVFNISTAVPGYDFAMVLSCLQWPLGQAFQLLSRSPHVSNAVVEELLAAASTVVGAELIDKVHRINMTDSCGFR